MSRSRLLTSLVLSLTATATFAVVPPEEGPLRHKAFRHPDLDYRSVYRPVAELPAGAARQLGAELTRLGVDPGNAYFDRRTGRWGTLIVTEPLIPGSGVGNALSWPELGLRAAPGTEARKQAAWEAFRNYLVDHAAQLRIDPSELGDPRVTAHGERLIQIHVGLAHRGIPVRHAFLKAAINSGNLVLLGQRSWATPVVETTPSLDAGRAEQVLREHLEGMPMSGSFKAPWLEIVPVSSQTDASQVTLGDGLEHRLVWVLTSRFADDGGNWEALVDAHSGELLAFQDRNHYASRRIEGAIFPVSNDSEGDDGTLQPGFPMPFADVTLDGEGIGSTTTGGNVPSGSDPGTLATDLSGPFMRMNDACGAIDESAETGDLDLAGVPLPATDCDVPPGHSPGDTNASRTGFYELNRLTEQARGYLPDNTWVRDQLTANMNINNNCNAFWNGSTVNFYTSGGGCANTGEIAAIFDHEWGHGMDNNDAAPSISRPGEGIADIYAQNRLNESCIGRNFRPGVNCGGNGDPCLDCTGVRETDWMKHQSMQPHDVSWILSNCGFPPGGVGPCGRGTHCEGHVVSESAWDLVHRDLMGFDGSPFDLDLNTALELGTRLTYDGSSNVGDWYQCVADGTGGCNPDSGYLGYLAADDDNGDLTDGTPHMSAIFAAFDRHQIACPSPAVQDAGCAGGPTAAPANVTATALDETMHLSWDPVAGASEYRIFRTEGVHGCEFGKALVGTTTGTEFVEAGQRNHFEVLYSVVAVGENAACTGPMSACASVTPEPGPGFTFDPAPLTWTPDGGDGDAFFDNCETGALSFDLTNSGLGVLSNLRIVDASIPSHPEAQILTDLPSTIVASLPEGAAATGTLQVVGGGFAFDDTLELEVSVTSDELAPIALPHTYSLPALESDLQEEATVTFSFEDGEDGWRLVSGTFDRTNEAPGGADGTTFYRASSANLDQNCDRIRSPLLRLSETSTLEIYNQFDIEGMGEGLWWDRANLGVFDAAGGERTVVSPDGGRLYNASGSNPAPAACASHEPPEAPGWADAGPSWGTSSWSPGALEAPEHAGRLVRLDVAYGTDPAVTGDIGFWFDEVTVTDVSVQVPDTQTDACVDLPELTFDPTGLDFGDVPVGSTSPAQTATLENTGDAAATEVTVDTADGGFAVDAGDCGATLPVGGTCEIDVTFAPVTLGPAEAVLDVGSGEGVGAGLTLTGNATEELELFTAVDLEADPTPGLSDGNGVFEPGELVEVRPTWRHDGILPHDLVGAASEFTGPAGANYTLVAADADYGGVDPGETSDCTAGSGCYEMALNSPDTRPETHWDAAFTESLSDETTRTWTLHVGDSFPDVPRSSPFYTAIETLLHSGVTGGCTETEYCPGDANSRSQMPVFMLRALMGPGYTPPPCVEGDDPFGDVPFDSTFCPWIQDLADRGIVSGCGGGDYCPGGPVSRAQMSIFLLKTLQGADYEPPECSNQFTDVPCPSLFADWIEDLAARGVTGGCTASQYCPGDAVSRAQMAVFITRAFGFTLYGP